MVISCPIHREQQGYEMTDKVLSAYMEGKKIDLEKLVFHFSDLKYNLEHIKSLNESWKWLKPQMNETYFNRYVDEYLRYPKGACSICFKGYLKKMNIKPQIVDIYITPN